MHVRVQNLVAAHANQSSFRRNMVTPPNRPSEPGQKSFPLADIQVIHAR